MIDSTFGTALTSLSYTNLSDPELYQYDGYGLLAASLRRRTASLVALVSQIAHYSLEKTRLAIRQRHDGS
jgi:hypothetical protein